MSGLAGPAAKPIDAPRGPELVDEHRGYSAVAELPDRRLADSARAIYRRRRQRDALFGAELFAEPVWDILVDLFIAHAEGRSICVSSACIGSSVPNTTALRHMERMTRAGLLRRAGNPRDARSRIIELTEEALERMREYLEGEDAPPVPGSSGPDGLRCATCRRAL